MRDIVDTLKQTFGHVKPEGWLAYGVCVLVYSAGISLIGFDLEEFGILTTVVGLLLIFGLVYEDFQYAEELRSRSTRE